MVMRNGRKVRDNPITGDIDEFRERVVAYMIGARDDFAHECPSSSRIIAIREAQLCLSKIL